MFCDKIENLRKYVSLHPGIDIIADFLEKNTLSDIPLGRVELADGIFMNMQEYEPYAAADKWETHRKYADLHIMVCGDEKMDGAPVSNACGGNGYSEEYDYEFFDTCGDSYATFYACPDIFVWFGTEDAHRPGIHHRSDKVKKAVFKIPV